MRCYSLSNSFASSSLCTVVYWFWFYGCNMQASPGCILCKTSMVKHYLDTFCDFGVRNFDKFRKIFMDSPTNPPLSSFSRNSSCFFYGYSTKSALKSVQIRWVGPISWKAHNSLDNFAQFITLFVRAIGFSSRTTSPVSSAVILFSIRVSWHFYCIPSFRTQELTVWINSWLL